jgi:hypothetical protein
MVRPRSPTNSKWEVGDPALDTPAYKLQEAGTSPPIRITALSAAVSPEPAAVGALSSPLVGGGRPDRGEVNRAIRAAGRLMQRVSPRPHRFLLGCA